MRTSLEALPSTSTTETTAWSPITSTAVGAKNVLDTSADQRRGQTLVFASISVSSSGSNAIVAAVVGKKIKVLGYHFVCDGAVTVKWQSASTDLTGAMSFGANGGISTPTGSPAAGWLLETAVNEALNLNLGGGVGVRGHLSYFTEA